KEKVTFKSNKRYDHPMPGMIVTQNNDKSEYVWNNINGFTTADLGLTYKSDFPVLIQRSDYPTSKSYLEFFNGIWENNELLEDVTDKVLNYFEKAFKENSPEYIYFITLYNIFNDFLNDLNQDNLPNERIGFKDSVVWGMLYNFQKDAVVGAINKLEKYGGCIIADSVGLGKTFSALGVIKYYEMRNKNVLVLCPKKLEDNWNTYRSNYKNNILVDDRFRYDVLFHTDLSRDCGMSNGINLANINWGNYDLVVIDESHNFRNAGRRYAEKENRYQRLMRIVIQEGVKTKVLMLSATPVNNRFNDLKNQLALAYEGNSEQIDKKLEIRSDIEQVFRLAQTAFNEWSNLGVYNRTTENLLDRLPYDFFEVLDAFTIARSRKHITTYYDISKVGRFPTRNKPISLEPSLTADKSLTYIEIAELLSLMNLSIYTPLSFLLPGREQKYADLYDKHSKEGRFVQSDRQQSLKVLMRINMLKRLESSVDSFRKTLQNLHDYIEQTLIKLNDSRANELEGLEIGEIDENFDWESEWGDEENLIGRKIKVHPSDIDPISWSEELEEDIVLFRDILQRLDKITPKEDNKLQTLIELIENKQQNPINDNNKKVVVFTAFSDTAEYLYTYLSSHFKEKYNLNSALITGSRRTSTSKKLPKDLNGLLTCFSPVSKGKAQLYPKVDEVLDILIATDCISEGQNLQDCDFLINYDIHWNPVRIIQRFGRIDRIGSINESITLVNFWPD
ncbi:MAG: DEAD/DEAH box helicase family protein, partial [Porphyromonadaceae bacterium]|nr:DEAD/DEAH box helicase family protein [Porphyromonadaceae bacterium]